MMLKRFAVSESGNFAAIFAIAAIPVVTAVAGAVDIAQTQRKASQVQQALDATALAMANLEMNGTVPTVAQAEAYFQANLANWSGAYPDFSYIAPTNPDSFAVLLVDLQAQAILGEAAEGELVRGVTASFRHEGITSFSVEWNVTRQASVRMAAGLPTAFWRSIEQPRRLSRSRGRPKSAWRIACWRQIRARKARYRAAAQRRSRPNA